MAPSGKWLRFFLVFSILIPGFLRSAQAQDPCSSEKQRALVLSGGGPKGAFETGAIYHLVVHRNCDFHEFSGSSVGALNAAFLAQAALSNDPALSHANLAAQTEALVSLWQSVKGQRDIMKNRRLATLRFGLFGLESLKDFQPLRRLLDANISLEKLDGGRPVRVGVVSFVDGRYREILARPTSSNRVPPRFLDYLYASSVPPLYGRLPRLPDGSASDDPKLWPQFTDGGLRHITPVVSYFKICKTKLPGAENAEPASIDDNREQDCSSTRNFVSPPHQPVQQLFVIVTSPYSRESDLLPVGDPKCCRAGTTQMTDGRKILGRTLVLLDDSSYRWDLDFLLFANDMLRWRSQAYANLTQNTSVERLPEARRQFLSTSGFVMESYNHDSSDREAPALPYDLGLIAPEKEYAEVSNLMLFSPATIQEQLYCGCVAADGMMERDFKLSSQRSTCANRFPPLPAKTKKAGRTQTSTQTNTWKTDQCRQIPQDRQMALVR